MTHTVLAFAPTCVEKVPDSHAIQSDSWRPPEVGRYFPAPQFWQAVTSFAPVMVEYLPGIQAMQASDVFAPDWLEYFPAIQVIHTSDVFAPD